MQRSEWVSNRWLVCLTMLTLNYFKDLFCVHCSSIGQLVMKEDTDVSGGKLRCRDSALR